MMFNLRLTFWVVLTFRVVNLLHESRRFNQIHGVLLTVLITLMSLKFQVARILFVLMAFLEAVQQFRSETYTLHLLRAHIRFILHLLFGVPITETFILQQRKLTVSVLVEVEQTHLLAAVFTVVHFIVILIRVRFLLDLVLVHRTKPESLKTLSSITLVRLFRVLHLPILVSIFI